MSSCEDLKINKTTNPINIKKHHYLENVHNIDNETSFSQYCGQFENDNENFLLQNNEYSLKENFFNPNKSSPPNDWTIRLNYRLNNKLN